MNDPDNPINARPDNERGFRAALDRVLLALEEHVVWRGGDLLKSVFEVVRRPFEGVAWVAQRGVVWPLQDRFALLDGRERTLASGSAVVLVGLIVVGIVTLVGSGGSGTAPSAPVATAAPTQPSAELSAATTDTADTETLHGAAPVFQGNGDKVPSEVDPARAIESAAHPAPGSSAATGAISSDPSRSPTTSARAATSAAALDGPPAGPKALAVAREFADAFVVYETGGERSEVRAAFAATATPELSRALLRRPPRLPKNVEVPKAKVMNVVAGPSHASVYTISVALLRVGVTSELRLDMEHLKDDGWRVTNVLG
jgi:hypothetical protein